MRGEPAELVLRLLAEVEHLLIVLRVDNEQLQQALENEAISRPLFVCVAVGGGRLLKMSIEQ